MNQSSLRQGIYKYKQCIDPELWMVKNFFLQVKPLERLPNENVSAPSLGESYEYVVDFKTTVLLTSKANYFIYDTQSSAGGYLQCRCVFKQVLEPFSFLNWLLGKSRKLIWTTKNSIHCLVPPELLEKVGKKLDNGISLA